MAQKRKPIEYRIDENGCFICISHKIDKDGYVIYTYREGGKRKQTSVHRYIYQQCFGEISSELVVMHKCDVRACCNPEHLTAGTNSDNMRDMAEKGRSIKGKIRRNFTKEERNFIITSELPNIEIANILNCDFKWIQRVRNNKGWKEKNGRGESKIDKIIEIDGVKKTIAQWAIDSGLNYTVIHKRVTLGWTGRDLLKPVRKYKEK